MVRVDLMHIYLAATLPTTDGNVLLLENGDIYGEFIFLIGLQVKKDLKTLSLLLQEVYQDQELIIHLTKVMDIIYYPQIEILV